MLTRHFVQYGPLLSARLHLVQTATYLYLVYWATSLYGIVPCMYVRTYVRMHVYTYVCAVPSYSPTLPSFAVLVGPSAQNQMHWESFILCEWVCTSCRFCRILIHIALFSQSHHFSIGTVEPCMISYDTNDEYCPYQERSNTRCTPWGRHVRTRVKPKQFWGWIEVLSFPKG